MTIAVRLWDAGRNDFEPDNPWMNWNMVWITPLLLGLLIAVGVSISWWIGVL